jgi:hypothetical protein
MQKSVFCNGELWKAQVIIPKTTMSCVDLAIKDADITNLQISKKRPRF